MQSVKFTRSSFESEEPVILMQRLPFVYLVSSTLLISRFSVSQEPIATPTQNEYGPRSISSGGSSRSPERSIVDVARQASGKSVVFEEQPPTEIRPGAPVGLEAFEIADTLVATGKDRFRVSGESP